MKWVHCVSLSHHSELLTFGEFPPASSQVSNELCLQNCPSSTDICAAAAVVQQNTQQWKIKCFRWAFQRNFIRSSSSLTISLFVSLFNISGPTVMLSGYLKWAFSFTWPWNQWQVLRFQGSDVKNPSYISNLTPSSSDWNHWFHISFVAFVRPLNLLRLAGIPLNIMFLWPPVGGLMPLPLILSPWKLHERKCRHVGEGYDMLCHLTLVTDLLSSKISP